MKNFTLIVASLFLLGANVQAEIENRSFTNGNIGETLISVPKQWQTLEPRQNQFGTTFYRLESADHSFDVEFLINDLKHMRMPTFTDHELEKYIKNNLSTYVVESIEKNVVTHRFGKNKDGVYARLTDGANNDEKFRLISQGARLFGNSKKIILFYLKSNDKDQTILHKILAIAASIRSK